MIQSVVKARTNAELIEYIEPLYCPDGAKVLDATWGKGKWWTRSKYKCIVSNDIDPESTAFYHDDFRNLRWPDGMFDVVAFDPAYIPQGGRETSTLHNTQKDGMLDRYGLHTVPKTVDGMNAMNAAGVFECARVTKPGGVVLVKCMDYISSGRYHSGLLAMTAAMQAAGLELVDIFIHHSGTGPQPKFNRDGTPRRQVHSRRAHSYLLVGRKK